MARPRLVKYACPVHADEILYTKWVDGDGDGEDGPSVMKMILPEAPKPCRQCSKSYYREECQTL